MSKTTKRKHVTREVIDEFVLPDNELQVVKVLASSGNNLHQVETADGENFLVSMPTKFRKNVWIKRGDFVLIRPIKEGDKVRAEIEHIVYKPQMRYIQSQGKWPAAFAENVDDCSAGRGSGTPVIPDSLLPPVVDDDSGMLSSDSDYSDDECGNSRLGGADTLVCNPNRIVTSSACDLTSDSEEGEEREGDEEEEAAAGINR